MFDAYVSVARPPTIWKLQWRNVSGWNSVRPYTYITSRDVNRTSPSFSLMIISAICSIRLSWLHIWYFFFRMALFRDLASRAILTALSFLTVTTTGFMNSSSPIFSTLLMCPSFSSFSISSYTASCNWREIRLPFYWVITASFRNSELSLYPLIFPCLLNNSGNFRFYCSRFCPSEMWLIVSEYPPFPFASPTLKFSWFSQSRPMRDRLPSHEITILAFLIVLFPTFTHICKSQ